MIRGNFGARHRAYAVPARPVEQGPALARRGDIRPIRYTFPVCDADWCTENLPVVRAAIGILGQDGVELVVGQGEAVRANPSYAAEMVRELNQRAAHFETLARVLRLARRRVEAAAELVGAIGLDDAE